MGFEAGNIITGEIPKSKVGKCPPTLSQDEVMFLLYFIKNSTFKGSQLENLFQVTLKLQEIYTYWESPEDKK